MGEIVLNPNSIYRNSQANFILNKDALYTFTRSVSAINDSLYGFQPSKQQLISGFELSDCGEHSLCVVVNDLDGNVSAIGTSLSVLKFFATRPFEVYETVDEMSANAKNPLAVYLVPVSADSAEHYEYIYVLPESISSWEEIQEIYNEGTYLSSLSGDWELIGSTSFTDEKISALTAEILSEIDGKISATKKEILSAVSEISGTLETKDDAAAKLNEAKKYADSLSVNYDEAGAAGAAEANANSYTNQAIESLTALYEPIGAEERAKEYTDEKASKYLPLSGGTMGGNIIVQPTKYFETREDDGNDGYYSIRYTGTTIDTRGSSLNGILRFPSGSGTLALEENVQQSIDALSDDYEPIGAEANARRYTDEKVAALSDEYVTKVELTASYPTRNQVARAIDDLSNDYEPKGAEDRAKDYTDGKVAEVSDSLSNFALSTVVADAYAVTVVKEATAAEGYAATYHVEQGGVEVGAKINIPKDYLVKSAELCTVTEPGVPYADAQVGDKYIDFVLNTDDSSSTEKHIYLPVNDLVDVYTGDSGEATRVSVYVNPETSVISAALLDKYVLESDILDANGKIANGLVVTESMLSNSINGDRIASNTMSGAKLKAGTVTADKIQDGQITPAKLTGNIPEARVSAIGYIKADYVKDGKLTIQQNGAFVQEFTANQGNDVTANIVLTGYVKTSDFNTIQGKVDVIDIKVNDLSNITIPGIQDQIDDIGSGIDNLSDIVNDLSGGAENLSDLYDDLCGRVDNAEDALDNLTDDLSTLSDDLDGLREKQEEDDDGRKREIEELCGYFDDLNGKQEEDRRDIDDLINKVGDNNVDNIRNLAEQAESIANRAATDSDIALGRANTANNTAEAANTTATNASATATQALTAAQTADQNATAALNASTAAHDLAVLTDSKLSNYILTANGEGHDTQLTNTTITNLAVHGDTYVGSTHEAARFFVDCYCNGTRFSMVDDYDSPISGIYLDANHVGTSALYVTLSDYSDPFIGAHSFGLSAHDGVLEIDSLQLKTDSSGLTAYPGRSFYVNSGRIELVPFTIDETPGSIRLEARNFSLNSPNFKLEDNPRYDAPVISASQFEVATGISADHIEIRKAREIDYIPTTPGGNISGNVTITDIALKLNEILRLLRNDPPPPPPPKVLLSVNYEYVDLSAGEEPEVKLYLNDAEVSPGTVLEVPIETIVKMEAVVSSTSTVGFGRWISEEDSFQSHSSTIYIEASNDAMYTAQIAKYGTEANPFIVDSPQALDDLRASVNGERSARSSRNYAPGYGDSTKYYLQTADLDMSGYDWEGIGMKNGDAPDMSHTFQGTYNGDGHAISNLTFKYVSGGELMGLFRSAVGATIKNLTVRTNGFNVTKAEYDADVTSSSRGKFGGAVFVGTTINSLTIDNCVAEGNLGTDDVPCAHTCAGFIANMDFATVGSRSSIVISNSTNRTNIKSTRKAGGIIGFAMDNITLTNVRNEGSISRVVSTNPNRAGDATREDSVAGILAHGHNDAGDAHCIVYDMDNVSNVGTITVNSGWAYESQSGQIVGKWATNTGTASTGIDIAISDSNVPLSRNAICRMPNIMLGVRDGDMLKTVSSLTDGGDYIYLFKNGSSVTPITLPDGMEITVEVKYGDLPVINNSVGTTLIGESLGDNKYKYSTK